MLNIDDSMDCRIFGIVTYNRQNGDPSYSILPCLAKLSKSMYCGTYTESEKDSISVNIITFCQFGQHIWLQIAQTSSEPAYVYQIQNI